MRPIAVSERILRPNCCRCRTVSATRSNRFASEPPTWRWMVTAVMVNSKFFEPTRSDMSLSASSIDRPSPVSVSTRLNSADAGGCPSSTTAWSPCLNEWPAFSDAAIVISRSGSCVSNAASLRRIRCQTTMYGTNAPTTIAITITIAELPAIAATTPNRSPAPATM